LLGRLPSTAFFAPSNAYLVVVGFGVMCKERLIDSFEDDGFGGMICLPAHDAEDKKGKEVFKSISPLVWANSSIACM
jgi:hypothetical protein